MCIRDRNKDVHVVRKKKPLDAADKLLYDLLYIREYSILLDLKIMLLTIKTVFTKERCV